MNATTLHDLWNVLPSVDGQLYTGDLVLVKMTATPPALFIAQGLPSVADFQEIENDLGFALEDEIQKAKAQYLLMQQWGEAQIQFLNPGVVEHVNTWRKLHVESVGSYFDTSGVLHVYATLRVNPNPVWVVPLIKGLVVAVVALAAAYAIGATANAVKSWSFTSPEAVKVIESAANAAPDSPLGDAAGGFKNLSLAAIGVAIALVLVAFKAKLK
ncbi:MAG: hypothetical protein ACKVWV_20325 [Planctomycetota bacterium]